MSGYPGDLSPQQAEALCQVQLESTVQLSYLMCFWFLHVLPAVFPVQMHCVQLS